MIMKIKENKTMSNVIEQVKEIIEYDETVKALTNENGCFKNIVIPILEEATTNHSVLKLLITTLAHQCALYDTLINNISQFGSKELIEKCKKDITEILNMEE